MDPFTIASLGLGTLGSAVGAVYNASTAADRKKKFLEEQQRIAQQTAMRHGRMTDFFDSQNYPIDAKLKQDQVNAYADEAFDVNPMDFVPFVSQGTKLAGAIYDAGQGGGGGLGGGAGGGEEGKTFQLHDPAQLEYYNPEQRGLDAQAPWDELEYRDPRQQQRWWQR